MANYLREFSTESAYTEATLNYPSVSLIDENGTVHFDPTAPAFNGKWKATYTGGTVSTAECDSTSAITSSDGFEDDGTLIEIEIGDCVTEIGQQAFNYCENLSAVTMPDSVTSIGQLAFCNCRSLTGITIPEGITSIGYNTFASCRSLTSIDIPDSVTSIDGYGFSNCSGLTSVTIPSGVTYIGIYAFISCNNLTGITCLATTPPTLNTFPFGATQFNDTNNCPIYVPSGSVSTYQSASGWSSYASRIQAIP